jgi:hypothetical protein
MASQRLSPSRNSRQPSAVKTMTRMFWDSEGVIHVDFLPRGVTINAQYYIYLLHNDVHQVIQKKRPGKLSKIILLHDKTRPHMANLMRATLPIIGWEVMNHSPYSPDLAPGDFHFFGPMKDHLGQKFQTEDELRRGVLNWLCSQDKTFIVIKP